MNENRNRIADPEEEAMPMSDWEYEEYLRRERRRDRWWMTFFSAVWEAITWIFT